jgi:hypothetical protein
MSYMLLIMEPHGQRAQRTPEQGAQAYESMVNFAADLKRRGLLRATESLKTNGVRVAARDGKAVRTDGPFVETKELLGGFFLLDCDDREQAIAIAAECPAAQWATVEVRELGPCFM